MLFRCLFLAAKPSEQSQSSQGLGTLRLLSPQSRQAEAQLSLSSLRLFMLPSRDRGHLWKAEPELGLGCWLREPNAAVVWEHQRAGAHPNASAKNMPFSSKLKFALHSSCSEERKPAHEVCKEGNHFLAKTFRQILILLTQVLDKFLQ